jgi:hypothetical protein
LKVGSTVEGLPKEKAELVPVGGEAGCVGCPKLKSGNAKGTIVVAVAVDEVVVGRRSGVDELRKEVEARSKLANGLVELLGRDEENVKPGGGMPVGAFDELEAGLDEGRTLGFPNEVVEEDQLG